MLAPPGRLIVALAVAGLALAGCGTPVPGRAAQAHDTAQAFLEACSRGDGSAVLEILTESSRDAFLRAGSIDRGCRTMAGMPPPAGARPGAPVLFGGTTVRSVHVVGAEAEATLSSPVAGGSTMELQSDGRHWHVLVPASRAG